MSHHFECMCACFVSSTPCGLCGQIPAVCCSHLPSPTQFAKDTWAALQGVQAAAGCAFAQTPGGIHPAGGAPNGKLGANYEAMSSFAKSAAKLSGKQLRTFGEVSFKYFAAHYDTWRGGMPPGSSMSAAQGA